MTSQRKSRGGGKPAGRFGFSIAGDKRKRLAEYPCVSRLRQRRLLVFLWSHKFAQTLRAFIGETDAFMDVMHLHKLVLHGQWSEAIKYLTRFLPSDHPLGVHGRALCQFLRVHKAIDDIVSGKKEALPVTAAVSLCLDRFFTRSPHLTKLRAIFSSLIESKSLRDSVDLVRVRCEASSIMHDLVSQTAELKDYMRPCGGSMNPQNVLPLGFGHTSLRPRHHVKKQGGQVPPSVLAGLYLQKKKKMLPSLTSSNHFQELTREALVKAKEWLVGLVGRSVEAGKPRQGDPVQSICSKGAPDPQSNFCTVRRPCGNSHTKVPTDLVILKEAKEWMLYLSEECLEAWPDARQGYPLQYLSKPGALAARVSETTPDILTRHAENSLISSVSEEGAPPARISQTIPDTLTVPAECFSISSVTKEVCNVQVPLRDTAHISGISSVTNEGSVLGQNMSDILTDHTKKLAISLATDSGTYTHLSQEDYYPETVCQCFSSRKNPRVELTTHVEGFDPENQRLALASSM